MCSCLELHDIIIAAVLDRGTDRGGWDDERQAEEHEEGHHLLAGFDVGHAESAVLTAVTRMNGFKKVRQLQEVQTHHRGRQDG